MSKWVEAREDRNHRKIMKVSEVNNNHKNKYGKLKTILSIWYFKRSRLPYEKLIKHKSIVCAHGGMQQWGVNYSKTYAPVVNWKSAMSLLAIESINDFPITWIHFVLAFHQSDLDVYIIVELPL